MSGIRSLPMIKLLTGLLLLVWPFLIWLGLVHNSLHWLLPLMALLLLLRLRQPRRQTGPLQVVTKIVAVVGIVLCVSSFLLKTYQLLLFYPVVVNAVMLAVFGGSLRSTMPIVERLARFQGPNLPERLFAGARPPGKGRAIYPPRNAGLVPVFYFQWQYCVIYHLVWQHALVDSLERYHCLPSDRFPDCRGMADTS